MHRWENFDKALDWIYSFTNLERDQEKRKDKESFQLIPISKMNQYFDNPSKNYNIIHIAGSKGKGTVSYLLSRYFIEMGYKVGLYTSPHIIDARERIQINESLIEEEEFLSILSQIYDYVKKIKSKNEIPSFFDIFTMLAFIYFSKNNVDIAIIEVGLGGRLDSTNIVNPILSVITSITYEHTEVLGKTLKKIASEKGGIIKENCPVVLGKNQKIVIEKIKEISDKKKSIFYYSQNNVKVELKNYIKKDNKILAKYSINIPQYHNKIEINSSLLGDFQSNNIETTICAILICSELLNIKFRTDIIKKILLNAFWISRFEVKYYKNRTIIIDGAHTEDSIRKLTITIKKMIKKKILHPKIAIIIGMMKDKNHEGILNRLLKISSLFYFVELDKWKDSKITNYLPIFQNLTEQQKEKPEYKVQDGTNWNGKDLIDKILESNQEIQTIIITGSLYLAQYFKDF